MSEENTGEVEDREEVEGEESQEEEFDPKTEIENLKNSLVEELKETRKRAQEAEADRDLLKNNNTESEEEVDEVDKKIQQALSKKEQEEVKQRREKAEESFRNRHKNLKDDSSGIKFAAVEKQLERFDLSKARTQEEFEGIYEDAYRLARKEDSGSSKSREAAYASDETAAKNTSSPQESSDEVSSKEREVIERLGWTEEKFLQQKKRRPSYVNRLINSPY